MLLIAHAQFLEGAPSASCAGCHREIYESYRTTPMASSSGRIGEGPFREDFTRSTFHHAQSGFTYRVSRDAGQIFFEFENPSAPQLSGRKPISYFVGSGAAARSYLLDVEGFLFEAPVAYYSAGAKWDLAPGYTNYAYPYLTRPAHPGCLNCHASFLNTTPGTQNGYGKPAFGEGGISCERCHGPGDAHIAQMTAPRVAGAANIVNPAKLDPRRRDSICSQCHLTGLARVLRPGRSWNSFRPGDLLSDAITVFVRTGQSSGLTVTSHVEKLAQSACKRVAGDRLWCGTCHDPHSRPAPGQRNEWYRSKCLGCHKADTCKAPTAARSQQGDNCIACHMPKSEVADALHVVYTDHSIPRRPRAASTAKQDADLVPFDGGRAAGRDLGLAYAMVAGRERNTQYRSRGEDLLKRAAREDTHDTEVLLYLGELYRNTSRPDLAAPLFRRAIELDPAQVTASVGLGAIAMERGEFASAIRLWEDALAKNPGLELVRINLALAQWRAGQLDPAESNLNKVISLSPGFAQPRELLEKLKNSRSGR